MADAESRIDLGIDGLGPAEHIGRGGFADVYRAEQLSLRRTVAVKVLRSQAPDADTESRFRTECHAIGAVSDHPYIVGVHEGGFTRNGRAYLVMEYLPGGSLADRVRDDGPMMVEEIVDTGIKIGKALSVAHRTGVLHRDVKPANIMMSAYGEPALGDFGIARIEGGPQTASGLVTASLAHVAPEVLEGDQPSAGSDIYSLASTMFELLTGRPPYYNPDDETIWPLMKRILSEPFPSPESVGLSARLGAVVQRATTRDVASRYGSAERFVEDLTDLAADPLALTRYPGSDPRLTSLPARTEDGPLSRGMTKEPDRASAPPRPAGPTPATRPDLTTFHQLTETRATRMPAQPVAEADPTVQQALAPDVPAPTARPSADPERSSSTGGPSSSGGRPSTRIGFDDDGVPEPASKPKPKPKPGRRPPVKVEPGRGRLGPILAAAAVVVAALGGAAWLFRDRLTGGAADEVAAGVTIDVPAAQSGPLIAGEVYAIDATGVPPGGSVRVVVDGTVQDASVDPGDASFTASAGRHQVALEIEADGEVGTTDAVSYLAAGADGPAQGYRAVLATIDGDRGWDTVLEVGTALDEAGHDNLELISTERFSELTPGRWILAVGGFGDDDDAGAAAERYCTGAGLDVPVSCYPAGLGLTGG